jgi:hypothetical protein
MADLEVTLPLPPGNHFRESFYLNRCRDLAWGAVGELPVLQRKCWPTQEKVRCEILLYTKEKLEKVNELLQPVIDAIGQVLWNSKTALPLIQILQVVNEEKEQALFRITYRKLISVAGNVKHYEW